ncbi:aminoglycoside phosphotransferase family protein [Paenibacillus sp. NPDC058177]|uniref:aminoglycoside phosphotransferase family protein n=1 Tax=Paenibacillus sp. NPDC058177 TaxID=3346369 RepID=UPI0036DA816A
MAHSKPEVSMEEVQNLIKAHLGKSAEGIQAIEGGNLSSVFSFAIDQSEYVIRFSADQDAFVTEEYVANLLTSNHVLFPQTLGSGKEGTLKFCISEKIAGKPLAEYDVDQRCKLLPDLIHQITRMNQVSLTSKQGFGYLRPDGSGSHENWEDVVTAVYAEDQTGTFWENWYALFDTSCLERDVFNECYARLLDYSKYNAPHRYFVHGDCHEWNILSDGCKITGIIDGNFMYGDFLIDIATIEHIVPNRDLAVDFGSYYEEMGVPIPDFTNRLIGARYFKGLDGLRFFAKMGWDHAYIELRDSLLSLAK